MAFLRTKEELAFEEEDKTRNKHCNQLDQTTKFMRYEWKHGHWLTISDGIDNQQVDNQKAYNNRKEQMSVDNLNEGIDFAESVGIDFRII